MMAKRPWEVYVEATVYVYAATRREAEDIAENKTERGWLIGDAYTEPVRADRIDRDWRDSLPLVGWGEGETEETCLQIAEHEAEERRVAEFEARNAVLPGVER